MTTFDNLACVPEGKYDPKHPWMGNYRRVEFKEGIPYYPPRRLNTTKPRRGRTYDWCHSSLLDEENIRDPRQQLCHPPSSHIAGEDVELIRKIRARSRSYPSEVSVIPEGYLGIRKEEKFIFSDGTIYYLTSTWIPDHNTQRRRSSAVQTEP